MSSTEYHDDHEMVDEDKQQPIDIEMKQLTDRYVADEDDMKSFRSEIAARASRRNYFFTITVYSNSHCFSTIVNAQWWLHRDTM
jgi:hypothetical protein